MQEKRIFSIFAALLIVLSPFVVSATTYTLEDVAGAWENNGLASGSEAPWWIHGPITFNADGTWSAVSEEYPSETSYGSGSFSISADGTIIISWTGPEANSMQCNMDLSKTVIVCTESWRPDSATVQNAIMVKKGSFYAQSDLTGTWGVTTTASGPGAPWWEYGTITITGNGSFSGTLQEYGSDPDPVSGVFSMSGDGVITWPGHTNDNHMRWAMNSGKTVCAGTSTWGGEDDPGTSELAVLTKRASSYTQADVSGTWAYHSLVSGGPDAPGWYRGWVTIDPSGTASFSLTDNTGEQESFTTSMLISSDGSFSGMAPAGGGCSMDAGKTVIACTITQTTGDGTVEIPIFLKTDSYPGFPSLTLTLTPSGTGSGTITSSPSGINCGTACSASYDTATQVTLNATPASGSYFSGFSTPCSGTSPCTFTLTATTQISATFGLQSPDYYDTVQKCYIGYYQRPADPGGLVWWAERLDEVNGNLNSIIEAFAKSDESKALYGEVNNDTISTVVDGIYMGLLSRTASQVENDYWSGLFKEGKISSAAIMLIMLNGAQNEDLTTINNKLTAANLFTRAVDPELDGVGLQATYAGNNDAEKARGFLTSVTTNAASVPSQNEATDYIKTYIADQGDGIF